MLGLGSILAQAQGHRVLSWTLEDLDGGCASAANTLVGTAWDPASVTASVRSS